ncbi:acetate--CoA ligase family protein [Alcaligenes endophyticus]|uniref:Acetate--CoA ligase family protein n=1 Tax=Alcaligenes endophyticus TaxID=1929088 RepID=A0ABT8EJ23_9BURK|nr:acetate--CoA ligase family protein [Alcaligenes endophyticus]MCX5591612.1 acetate--CoA ligase family protein [Alcaligenes endophyticus]MDN4121289.1 acetate--CoA ligase family protein [Alcaligenes endophyticus]
MNSPDTLKKLFAPQSIAIVGASETIGKIGAIPITLLKKYGYQGDIYPVNPRSHTIQGLDCYASLADIPTPIDLVIIAVPAQHAYTALANARPGMVAGAVLFSSGFAEIDEAGRIEQERLSALAQERGIRLLGPNCLGFMNIRENTFATFSPVAMNHQIPVGNIGVVSQSGAFGAYACSLMLNRGMGLSSWITTGNESDIDVADCIALLAADPHTDVIMAYLEGCQDGEKLKRAFIAADQANKRIVITKVGRTQAGAQAAASHTAALAGDDAVYDALFHQYGILRTHSIDEFFNVGQALSVWRHPTRNTGLAVMSLSGGVGALMADDAQEMGLSLPAMPKQAQNRLLQRVPFAGTQNPVDVTGQAVSDPTLFSDTAHDMLSSGQFGALVVFLAAAGSSDSFWPHIERFAESMRASYPDIPFALVALLPEPRRRALEKLGCLTFTDPSTAVRTVGALLKRNQSISSTPPSISSTALPLLPTDITTLNEVESLAVLNEAGIPSAPILIAHSATQAAAISQQLNRAVVMKILSRDILHKSDIGGIRLNITSPEDAITAFQDITSNVQSHAPAARIDGVLIAPMIAGGIECIAGVHRDPVFGPVVMFGLGGIFVEILQDTSFRLAPFDETEAISMIQETRASQILAGARGRAPADIEALAKALACLSQLAYASRDQIESIDINPLVVLEQGQGVVALDALVMLSSPTV